MRFNIGRSEVRRQLPPLPLVATPMVLQVSLTLMFVLMGIQWTPPPYYPPYSYEHGYSSWYGFSTPRHFSTPQQYHNPPVPWSHPSSMDEQLPYVVKLLNNRIKKCRGCGSLFARKADRSVPDPPNDLIIVHEELTDASNVILV